MKNIYLQVPLESREISELVIATVTSTSGSTPQKAGSSALFNRSGLICGTIGGGILEGKVQEIARAAALSKKSGNYLFRLDTSAPGGEDALCGGSVSVLVDSTPGDHIQVFSEINRSLEARIPGILTTMITGKEDDSVVIRRYWISDLINSTVPQDVMARIGTEAGNILSSPDPSGFREIGSDNPGTEISSRIFLEPIVPPVRLIIAGGGHIGKALSKIGQMLDFEITVIDDRAEFANPENIKSADHLLSEDIGSAISRIEKNRDTFIVIVTRGHKDDEAALKACIGSDAGYIGMIGSRNKVESMRREFMSNGWASQEQWERVCAPIGLDIKSKTVEEIAVSIAAQLVQVKNSRTDE
jgi:xanthine dehydrogenase accessory factor